MPMGHPKASPEPLLDSDNEPIAHVVSRSHLANHEAIRISERTKAGIELRAQGITWGRPALVGGAERISK